MTSIGPRIAQAYEKKEGGKERGQEQQGEGAISSTEEGSSSSSSNSSSKVSSPVLMTTVDEVNSTADSVYGLVEAVNRSTLARVAESKMERELKASLKLGKADDVTLPWGKTLLAKPLIRLNAAMLPPALAEMVGCTKRAMGADSATVFDGLVAWIDKAVGKKEGGGKEGGKKGEKASGPLIIEEEEEEGEGERKVTGAGDLEREAGTTTSTISGEEGEEDAASASITDNSRAFHLVCALKTNSSPTAFEGMKVVHQIRLYQLHYLAQGIGFVGPSATPTFSADFVSQRILTGGDGGPGAHGGNPLLMGKNQQLFPGLTSVSRSRLAAYVSHAGNGGRDSPMSPGRMGRHFERHGGAPGGGMGNNNAAAAAAAVMSGLSEAFAGRGGGGGMPPSSSMAPGMGGRARLSVKDSTLTLGHGHLHHHHAHPHASPAFAALQEECWALRRRNEELGALKTELLQLAMGGKHDEFPSPGAVGVAKRAGALASPQAQTQVTQLSALVHGTVEKFTKVIWDTFGFDVRKEGVASLRQLRIEIVSHLDTLIAQEDILESFKGGFGSGGSSGSIGGSGTGTLGGSLGMGPGGLPPLSAMPPPHHHRNGGAPGHHHGGQHNPHHNHHQHQQYQQQQLQQQQYPHHHSYHHNAHHHAPPHHLAASYHHHQHHRYRSPASSASSLSSGEEMFR